MAKATLFDPKTGRGTVVETGSKSASTLQSKGFTLNKPTKVTEQFTPTKQATLFDPESGVGTVVDVGSAAAGFLQEGGFGLTPTEKSEQQATLFKGGRKEVVRVGSPGAATLQGAGFRVGGGGVLEGLQTSGQEISTREQASQFINQDQADDFAKKEAEGLPETKAGDPDTEKALLKIKGDLESAADIFGEDITTPQAQRPDTTNLVQLFQDLRAGEKGELFNVADLETELNALKKEERDVLARRDERIAFEADKPVRLGVIGGKVSEIERQEQQQIDFVRRQQAFVNDQLNTKLNAIDMMVNLTQTDFENATNQFNTEFDQQIRALNFVQDVRSEVKDEKQKAIDNAQATLNTIYNNFSKTNFDVSTLTDQQDASIRKLEVQAGYPQGFFETLQVAGVDEVLTQQKRVAPNGDAFMDVIIKKADGSFGTVNILLGKEQKFKGTGAGGVGGVLGFKLSSGDKKTLVGVGFTPSDIDDVITSLENGNTLGEIIEASKKEKNLSDKQAATLRGVFGDIPKEPSDIENLSDEEFNFFVDPFFVPDEENEDEDVLDISKIPVSQRTETIKELKKRGFLDNVDTEDEETSSFLKDFFTAPGRLFKELTKREAEAGLSEEERKKKEQEILAGAKK